MEKVGTWHVLYVWEFCVKRGVPVAAKMSFWVEERGMRERRCGRWRQRCGEELWVER